MITRKILPALIYVLCFCGAYGQQKNPAGGFGFPIDEKIFISGTFGELRPNHFHSGIDFSTKNRIGQNIYAIADGWVSRIKVSSTGYGKVIYITHYNGYVSVYAHLSEFYIIVNDYVTRKQYEKETYEIELFPPQGLFKLKKGEVVGYSGNTGSSSGPHLHFEIRREKTERPVNPAIFGIYDKDVLRPVIHRLRVYPSGEGSTINGSASPLEIKIDNKETVFTFHDTIFAEGSCYFGIHADDFVSGRNSAGLYSVDLLIDSMPHFSFRMDSFAFSETRYINDLIDYAEHGKSGIRYQLTRISPGNKLPVYRNVNRDGALQFNSPQIREALISVADFAGNEMTVKMLISGKPAKSSASTISDSDKNGIFHYDRANHFETADIIIDLPAFSLYDSINFIYSSRSDHTSPYSKIHCIHNKDVPLHKAMVLSLLLDSVPEALKQKAAIVRIVRSGNFASIGGEIRGKYLQAKTTRFGDYQIAVDTTAPRIRPENFRNGNNISSHKTLNLRISDDLSGLRSYRAEINGNWAYMEYDAKNHLLVIPVNETIPSGLFELIVKVEDECRNVAIVKFELIR